MTKIEAIREAVANAQSKWTDLDWETGTEPTEAEREECEADAKEASDEGDRAIEAAIRGDWDQVVRHAEEACRIERQYGDDPAWRPVLDLARELSAPTPITITLDARADLSAAGDDRDEADDYAAAYEEAAAWLSSQCGLDITVLESRYFDDAERDTSTGIEQDVWQACHDLVVRGVDGTWTSSESQSVAEGIRRAMRAVEV